MAGRWGRHSWGTAQPSYKRESQFAQLSRKSNRSTFLFLIIFQLQDWTDCHQRSHGQKKDLPAKDAVAASSTKTNSANQQIQTWLVVFYKRAAVFKQSNNICRFSHQLVKVTSAANFYPVNKNVFMKVSWRQGSKLLTQWSCRISSHLKQPASSLSNRSTWSVMMLCRPLGEASKGKPVKPTRLWSTGLWSTVTKGEVKLKMATVALLVLGLGFARVTAGKKTFSCLCILRVARIRLPLGFHLPPVTFHCNALLDRRTLQECRSFRETLILSQKLQFYNFYSFSATDNRHSILVHFIRYFRCLLWKY